MTEHTGKQKTFSTKADSWGFRVQMAGELFGDPASARSVPVRMVSNISGNKQHAYYVLSETMVRFLDQPTETGTDLFRAYQDACALAIRGKEVQADAREEERFSAVAKVARPFGSALYLDFLRLLWRFAPETGRATGAMITALGRRYGLRRRSVYNYIEQAEQHFVRTLRAWHQEQNKNALLVDVARTQERQRRARESGSASASPQHVPAGVVLDAHAQAVSRARADEERARAAAIAEALAVLRDAQAADAAARAAAQRADEEDASSTDGTMTTSESEAEIMSEQGISVVELAEELETDWRPGRRLLPVEVETC